MPALRLSAVGLTRGGRHLLDGIDLTVEADERWVLLGANGSGKTSLVRIAALVLAPSRGRVEVLGAQRGHVDLRSLRPRIGVASSALSDALRPDLTALEIVMTARTGALEPCWHTYDESDRVRALDCLVRMEADDLADHSFGILSSGERQRVLVARTLCADPGLLLLDEPTAGLDLGGRERLVAGLDRLAADPATAPIVFVTHHVEEIPPSFTDVVLLREGRILTAGDLGSTLTSEALSAAFAFPLKLQHRRGRWSATAR